MTPRRRPFLLARVAKRGKFIRKVFTGVFCRPLPRRGEGGGRGEPGREEDLEVDPIGAALSEFLIRDIPSRASTNVKRNEVNGATW